VHDVEVERHPPRVGVGVLDARLARRAARIGDEQIEPAQRLAGLRDEALERRPVGDVDRRRVDRNAAGAQLVGRARELVRVARADRQRAALGGQPFGRWPARCPAWRR
jgi:hypothetical protein